ncbi:2-keto-4-pentenoate hydratase [Paracoccus aminophilus]|uniref:2-keto-4-pentenoate hydratase n=1 Tax=Paracoccus aminophilus JCM 7686 TaxID=1367847 RepID=S5YHN8_PARAH|nr:fumarylacetoacetate hydrolase family protein [Paracoccus aminophilus]AGT10978.1 2-keto-4-pentenoate hydratase [Paracoccus aminophilus JCM 7686]
MTDPAVLSDAASALRNASASGTFIAPLRETYPGLTAADAYAIQAINTQLKRAAGVRVIGTKIGLTSPAVQQQLGVDQPDYGVLFDDMWFPEGLPIPMVALHQPKIEAEVAFVLGRDLDMERPGFAEVLRAIDYALPALEIVGSRIADWNIGLVDTIADNASSSAFVLGGSPRRLEHLDLRAARMQMTADGLGVSQGGGAACLGHPLNAVVWLAQKMAALGAPLQAGQVVLSGALGPMSPVAPGQSFTARIEGFGPVTAVFAEEAR